MIKFTVFMFLAFLATLPENISSLDFNNSTQDSRSQDPAVAKRRSRYVVYDPYPDRTCWKYVRRFENHISQYCLEVYRRTSQIAQAITANGSYYVFQDYHYTYEYIVPIINTTHLYLLTRDALILDKKDLLLTVFCLINMSTDITVDELTNILFIISSIIDAPVYNNKQMLGIFNICTKFLNNLHNIITPFYVSTPNLMLAIWNPFQTKCFGWSWIKTEYNYNFVNPICGNWSERLIRPFGTSLVAYLPQRFLENIARNVSIPAMENVFAIMFMTDSYVLTRKFLTSRIKDKNSITQIVGVSIPGFCKRNNFPMLKIIFNYFDSFEFGEQYIDDYERPGHKCTLSQMSYFGRVSYQKYKYLESPLQENCVAFMLNGTYWRQTPAGFRAYPAHFCINRQLQIPHLVCDQNAIWKFPEISHLECSNEHNISNVTTIIYNYATNCWDYRNFSQILNVFGHSYLTFIDMKMFYDILECIDDGKLLDDKKYFDSNFESIFHGIQLSLELLEKLPKLYTETIYLHNFMISFFKILNLMGTSISKIYKNYIYLGFGSIGNALNYFAIRRGEGNSFCNYKIIPLDFHNDSMSYTSDEAVEVIIKVTGFGSSFPAPMSFSVIVIYGNLFPGNDGYTSKSRTIFVVNNHYVWLSMDVYLRIIDDNASWRMNYYTGEGYWFTIDGSGILTTYIRANKSDYCDTEEYLWKGVYGYRDRAGNNIDRTSKKKMDILSMISMSVNNAEGKTGVEDIYNKYSTSLKVLRLTGTCMSFIGITAILLSGVILREWRKPRFYTIQLSIALELEIVFFIIDSFISEIPQVGFYIFYYCILSQFSWMSLIGYMQYIKYIQIFRIRKIGIIKSLIIGWLIPLVIISVALLVYRDCLKCNLCYKNKEMFMFFVFIPIGLVIIVNFIIYVIAMVNIWKSKSQKSGIKYQTRAAILLPFLLGITWSFMIMLVCPWTWLSITGLFLMHIVVPSQGFVLFVFVVLLDKKTRLQWKACFSLKKRF